MSKTKALTIIVVAIIAALTFMFGPAIQQQAKFDTCKANGGPAYGCALRAAGKK